MPEGKNRCQQIHITHKCGGSFTIQPETFIESRDQSDKTRMKCLNCFELFESDIEQKFDIFCKEYKQIVDEMESKGYCITMLQLGSSGDKG